MRFGPWDVYAVCDGTFLLDGGSMFGIVPRPLWSQHHPPDDQNRIVMALRALLLIGSDRRILIDCGIGDRFLEKQQEIYGYQKSPEGGLPGQLGRLDLQPEDITDIVATHLHFDHVAGMLTRDAEGQLVPTFPKASVHIQEECWAWAHAPSLWDRGSFFHDDFDIWEQHLRLRMLRGDQEIADGIRVKVIGGHTPGQQIVVVGSGKDTLVYCGDLIPTATHIRLPYIMAYDHQPLKTLEEKKILLAQALEEDWVLVFEHDPQVEACRLEEKNGRPVAGQGVHLAPR